MIIINDINRAIRGDTPSKRRVLSGSRAAVNETEGADSSQRRLSAEEHESKERKLANNQESTDTNNKSKPASSGRTESTEEATSSIETETYNSAGYRRRCFRIDIKA